MSAPVMHFEISARDRARLGAFYADLFGWECTEYPDFGYTMLQTAHGRGIDGGISEVGPTPAGVIVYAQVDDVERTLAKAIQLGATAVQAPYDVPGVGRFAVFSDPEGNRTGLWRVTPQQG